MDLVVSLPVSSLGFACMLYVTCASDPVALAAAIAAADAGIVSAVGVGPPSGGGVLSCECGYLSSASF